MEHINVVSRMNPGFIMGTQGNEWEETLMLKKLKRCEVIRVAGPRGDYAPLVDELKGLRDVLTNGATFDIDLALGWCEDNLIWCEQNGADELSEIVESENFDDFVARLELEPRMGRSIRRQFREYIYHNLIERCNGVWKDGGSPDDEGVVAWIREPENWLHRNNSHEVYAAMADHLGIKLTHENKRKMTKIIREALIADYEDNPDECYEWIVQLGLKVDELDIFEYQPWLHRVAQPLEALPSPPLPRQAT